MTAPALFGLLAAACVALALAALPGLKERPIEALEAIEPPREGASGGRTWRLVERLAALLGPGLARALSVGRRRAIERRLALAGQPADLTVPRYVGIQAALALLGLLAALLLMGMGGSPVLAALAALMGWGAPEVWLSRAGRLRQERIERDLPDFLDILSVTVRAGLGYRLALQRVADSLGGPVGEEMTTALRQMGLGVARREAFLGLRERNASEALSAFVAAQLQAEELGVPLADALNDIAADMRRMAHQSARRRAQRAAPRVSLITTTLIVPGAIILLLVSLLIGSGATESGLLGG